MTGGGDPSSGYCLYEDGTLFSWYQHCGKLKELKHLSGHLIMLDDDVRVFDSKDEANKVIGEDQDKNHYYYDLDYFKLNLPRDEVDEGESNGSFDVIAGC